MGEFVVVLQCPVWFELELGGFDKNWVGVWADQ